MTGFGSATVESGAQKLLTEIRSVNHRYCDVRLRIPSEFQSFGFALEALVRRRISRGRVDVTMTLGAGSGQFRSPLIDFDLAKGYHTMLTRLAGDLGVPPKIDLRTVVSLPGVVGPSQSPVDPGALRPSAEATVQQALDALMTMRDREGQALGQELREHLSTVEGMVLELRSSVPEATLARKERLERRLGELNHEYGVDPIRLAQEVSILVDRSDFTEELERLESHTQQFASFLGLSEPVGRKLDFLLQEMNREANTMGSKCGHAATAHRVVGLKAELERMREQVQNVE